MLLKRKLRHKKEHPLSIKTHTPTEEDVSKNNVLQKKNEVKSNTHSMDVINGKMLKQEFFHLYQELEKILEMEAIFFNNHCCPNCGSVFEKEIKTSKNCPHCKKRITKRSNYLTKQNYLIDENKVVVYNTWLSKYRELNFYEEILRKSKYNYLSIEKYLTKNRSKSGIVTPRDLLWNTCNEMYNDYISLGLKEFNKIKQYDDFLERISCIHIVENYFYNALHFFKVMIDIAEYKKQEEVLETMIPYYVQSNISVYLLYHSVNDIAHLDENILLNIAYSKHMCDFILRNNLSLLEYEKIYKQFAREFIIPTLKVNDGWELVKTVLLEHNLE